MNVSRCLALPLAVLVAGSVSWDASAGQDEGIVVPSGVQLVRLDVVVLDGDGQPVTGLTADDFVVEDEGRPQRLASFEPVVVKRRPLAISTPPPPAAPPSASELPQPEESRHLLIFFDDIHVSAVPAEYIRTQLAQYLHDELRDGDTVTIVAPESGIWWTARNPYEYAQLPKVVAGLSGRLVRDPFHGASRRQHLVTEWEAMQLVENPGMPLPISNQLPGMGDMSLVPDDPAGAMFLQDTTKRTLRHEEIYAKAQDRIRRTLKVFDRAVASLVGFRGHKSLVMISEGFILSPRMKERYDQAIDAAVRARVAVDFIDPEGLTSGAKDASYGGPMEIGGHEALRREHQIAGTMQIVSATGGREFLSNDLVKGVQQALSESSAYYLLGYEMPKGDETERHVTVKVKRKGLKVLAPERYFTQPLAAPPDPEEAALEAVYDATDLPVRVRSLLGGATPEGDVEATLVVGVGSLDSDHDAPLSVSVEARPATGGPGLHGSYETTLRGDGTGQALTNVGLKLHPGVWQARVLVEEKGTGRRGSVLHTFEVPPGNGLRVTTPFVSDELVNGVSPRLRVDWTFPEDHPVYCGFAVWGAPPDTDGGAVRVTARYELSRNGAVVEQADVPLVPLGDVMLWGSASFAPGSLEPGSYTLRIEAVDPASGDTNAVEETFAVAARGTS